jgi:transcriptional regulator with XRE-family HTH domain
MLYVAALVLEARERARLDQVDLARLAGVSRAQVSRIENGRARPSLATLERLLAACGVELDIRLTPAGSLTAAEASLLAGMSVEERLRRHDLEPTAALVSDVGTADDPAVVTGDLALLLHAVPVRPRGADVVVPDDVDPGETAERWDRAWLRGWSTDWEEFCTPVSPRSIRPGAVVEVGTARGRVLVQLVPRATYEGIRARAVLVEYGGGYSAALDCVIDPRRLLVAALPDAADAAPDAGRALGRLTARA